MHGCTDEARGLVLAGYYLLCVSWAILQARIDNRSQPERKEMNEHDPGFHQRPAA